MDETVKVAVEVRPRIRTSHFFVKSIREPKSVKISEPNIILIIYDSDDKEMSISSENLNLTPDSVTCLQLTNNSLYFQTRSNPDNLHGSFRCELLMSNELSGEDDFSYNYKPDIELGMKSQLYCRCCSAALLQEDTMFERILPLPDSDGSDFFCHKHGENFVDLNPKLGDCFYSNFYFKINSIHVHKPNAGIMYCPNCNSWLGIREEFSVTLWNSCVKLNIQDAEVKEQAIEDFVSLVKALANKQFGVTCKIIFNARINDEENHYLLLWVMDKNLALFVDDVYQDGKLLLKEIKVAKVLYAYEKLETDMVKQWKQDIKTNEEEISRPMMEEGLRLLEDMANIIPDDFRKANQLSVSYIK